MIQAFLRFIAEERKKTNLAEFYKAASQDQPNKMA